MNLQDSTSLEPVRQRSWWRWQSVPLVLACAVIVIGAIAYCATPYEGLCAWYLSLNPCIYKVADWQREYFTPAVKAAGNGYAVAGAVVAAMVAFRFMRRMARGRSQEALMPKMMRQDWVALSLLYVFGAGIWLWGTLSIRPSYDEVFSLMDCARTHLFQSASYYMRPNNHVLFNLLNALPARLCIDGVLSGRVISGLASALLPGLLYFYLRRISGSRLIAGLICVVMMLQFVVWGFSVQARGYALLLAASWGAFIFLDLYLGNDNQRALALHGLCIVVGCWTVPSFLFWWVAMLAYAAIQLMRERKMCWPLLRMQVMAGAAVYLAYLPSLLFTGRHWLSGNGYVAPFKDPMPVVLLDAWRQWRGVIQYAFSHLVTEQNSADWLLALLPLAIYPFIRRRAGSELILFYAIAWMVFGLIELTMRHFPPYRGLIAHQSLSLAAVLTALWLLLSKLLNGKQMLRSALMALFCVGLGIYFIRYNRDNKDTAMYGYSLKGAWNSSAGIIERLLPGTKLATSAESFYPRYICLLRGIPASDCIGEGATMYIKRNDDPVPEIYAGRLFMVASNDDYELYLIRK